MRLILSFLSLAQIRLARHDILRSDMLLNDAAEAVARSKRRLALSNVLARRAGFELRE